MSRTEASRCRATHVKLTRDFRTVETTFRKLQLDVRRKRNFIEAQRREREDNERRRNEQEEFNQETMKFQMQMQEDVRQPNFFRIIFFHSSDYNTPCSVFLNSPVDFYFSLSALHKK